MRSVSVRVAAGLFVPLLLAVPAARAGAQMCLGTASFAAGPLRIGAAAEFADGGNAYGGEVAFGSLAGPFVSGGVAMLDFDDTDESATLFSVNAGYTIPLGTTQRAQFCPLVGFDYQNGPDFDTGLGTAELSARAFSFGGALGGTVASTQTLDVVPFVGARYVNLRQTLELGGQEESESEDYGVISVGVGFVMSRAFTLRPTVNFPVGLEDADPTYGLSLSFNFGTRSR